MAENTSTINKVIANDDLLIEILLRLPVRSLLRFKSVSRRWFSLINNPTFYLLRNSYPRSASGLFLHPFSRLSSELKFIPLENDKYKAPKNFPSLSSVRILSSCNGLFVCSTSLEGKVELNYFVYNPTTDIFTLLPRFGEESLAKHLVDLTLAFDPSKSPHYKVIRISSTVMMNYEHFQIEIYSSETRTWKNSCKSFTPYDNLSHEDILFGYGVYWNGAINWMSLWGDSFYFNVDEERIGIIPILPIREGWHERQCRYFGESRGHLHFIEIYGSHSSQFDVYEMKKDYSEWFLKYHVDLDEVMTAFPDKIKIIRRHPEPMNMTYYCYAILSVVERENDEDSFMVMHIPGKIICYNFVDKTFNKICDIAPDCANANDVEDELALQWFDVFEFNESLACVW